MGLVAKKEAGEKVQREYAKKGPRPAILSGLVDVGRHVREFQGEKKKPAREYIPIFTLVQDMYTDQDGVEHNMIMSPYFPVGLFEGSERSKHYKICKALDPDDVTLNDGERDLTQLIGRKCYVQVKHNVNDGITYANFEGVSEIPEDYPLPDIAINKVIFDCDNPDKAVFDKLWDRTKDEIRSSLDYAGSELEGICEGTVTAPAKTEDEGDDDIPF